MKMAFKKVGEGNYKYVKYTEAEPGQVLAEGVYAGSKQGTYGIQHHFRKGDEITVLNSSGHLNYMLENYVTKGDTVRVKYKGTEQVTKGKFKGKDMHQFEVLVDDSVPNTIPESLRTGTLASVPDTDDDDDDLDDESDEDTDDTDADEAEEAPAPKKKTAQDVIAKYRKKA